MSLFRRDSGSTDSERTSSRPPETAPMPSPVAAGHVAAGSRLEGTLSGSTDWVIDGEVEGTIAIEGRVTIGPTGKVTGAVRGRSIRLAGRIDGDVSALERVEIVASGHLEGNISAPRVIIDEGAFFKGSVEMAAGDRAAGPGGKARSKERKS